MITDKHFRDWESHAFGYGYGTGEVFIIPELKLFFETTEAEGNYNHRTLEQKLGGISTWLLINILCHADMLEYGTSPRYG
jgi:hypothetical protein